MSREERIADEAVRGILPALPKERVWGTGDHVLVQTAFSIATWLFMMGAWTGFAVPAYPAIFAAILGNSAVMFFISYKAKIYARYGVDEFIGARSAFGSRGGNEAFMGLFVAMNMGWISIPVVMFGYAWTRAAESFDVVIGPYWIYALICFILAMIIVYIGPTAMTWMTRISAPAMMALIAGFSWHMVTTVGWKAIAAIRPEGFFGDRSLDYAWAIEGNVGLGFSWTGYYGSYYRLCKSERTAYYGTFLGWGVLWGVLCIPGIFVALLIGSLDPTDWMIAIGGPVYGLVGLALLILANVTSAACVIYAQTVAVRTIKIDLKWRTALLTNIPALILVFLPAAYESYGGFVTLIGAVMGPFGSVLLVDVLFIHKGKYNLLELYNRKGNYYYWGGVNWIAFLCAIIGLVMSFSIFNPLTFVFPFPWSAAIFKYITASAPSAIVAGLLYLALGKAILSRTTAGKKTILA